MTYHVLQNFANIFYKIIVNKINEEKPGLENQKKELQKQLAHHNTENHRLNSSKTFSTEQKLQIYSDLFKGRNDTNF